MVEKQKDSLSVEKNDNRLFINISCPVQFNLRDTPNNRKVLYVLLRLFKTENCRHLITFQAISALFGLKTRQDSNNYYREFQACDEDLLSFLKRKKKLEGALPLIEELVLKMPLLSISEQYKIFSEDHPEYKMSQTSFQKYYTQIDSMKLKKRYDELITDQECRPDKERFLKEMLAERETSKQTRKQIISIFPELEESKAETRKNVSFFQNMKASGKYFLIMFLIASNCSFEVLSILFGVSKATIHNWFYQISFLKRLIFDSIKWWSGIISVDEKWIKINGKWYYLLSIVDNVTGFPLYFALVSNLNAESWEIFFHRFYKLYGIPKLIISDGSKALAKGRIAVFPIVPTQLCKFHKLKNLNKRIYLYARNYETRSRMLKLAENIFKNTSYYGRKRAARRLIEIAPPKVYVYVKNNILGDWRSLTKGYTSNASERWNRKIEKVISGRYGLKSEKFVEQLIAGLWLKECIRDKRHLQKSFIREINIKSICQENVKMCNIIDFVRHKLLQKVA